MVSMSKPDFSNIKREERTIAGKTIGVAVTPRLRRSPVGKALKGLAQGMGVTFGYFAHPSRIVTRQYPENRATLKFPERFRAMLALVYDENGYHHCTACRMCERACPNASIRVVTRKGRGAPPRNELDRYVWRMDSCVMCNACVQSCPFGALKMTHDFENAVYDRRLLIFNLNRYAGPPAGALLKEADPQARQALMDPRTAYDGPVPLNGTALPGIRPLPVAPESPAAPASPEVKS